MSSLAHLREFVANSGAFASAVCLPDTVRPHPGAEPEVVDARPRHHLAWRALKNAATTGNLPAQESLAGNTITVEYGYPGELHRVRLFRP